MDIYDASKFKFANHIDLLKFRLAENIQLLKLRLYLRSKQDKVMLYDECIELLKKLKIKHVTLLNLLKSPEIPTHRCKELLNELEMLCDECNELLEKIEIPFNFLQTAKDCIKGYEILTDEAEKREQQYCTKESHKANIKDCMTWTGQTPKILADAGFFYKDGVRLQGYKCKIVTSNQNIGSYPFEEHGRISPNCNHVKMKESKGENIYSSGQRTDIERTYIPVKLSNHQTEHWIEGDNAFAFTCEVEDNNVTVDWFHNDELVVPSNKHLIRNVKKKHTLLIKDFDPADISDYTVIISDNSCSQKIQFDAKTFPSVVLSCSPGYLWQKLGYETAQKPSTTQEYTYSVSDADTFDKHKKKWVYMEQTTCGKVSLPMETLNNTVKGQAIQNSINYLNLKSNNNHNNLFTFNPSIPQSTNGCSHRLWYYQFSQFKGTPGFLTEVLTHDLTVFRERTFHTNYLSQTSVGLSMHLCNGELRQSDVEDLCELVIF